MIGLKPSAGGKILVVFAIHLSILRPAHHTKTSSQLRHLELRRPRRKIGRLRHVFSARARHDWARAGARARAARSLGPAPTAPPRWRLDWAICSVGAFVRVHRFPIPTATLVACGPSVGVRSCEDCVRGKEPRASEESTEQRTGKE